MIAKVGAGGTANAIRLMASVVPHAVLDDIRRDRGAAILLHDHDRTNKPGREAYVLELTRAILEMARNEGFKVYRLPEIYDA